MDRLNLSRMNNKLDEQRNIYVFITRKEMGEFLKSSSKTVIKVLGNQKMKTKYWNFYNQIKYIKII